MISFNLSDLLRVWRWVKSKVWWRDKPNPALENMTKPELIRLVAYYERLVADLRRSPLYMQDPMGCLRRWKPPEDRR